MQISEQRETKPKPTTRSLIPARRLRIDIAYVDMDQLFVGVSDRKTGRDELLRIAPPTGIKHVPSTETIRILINLYIKYDLLSQDQFICLTEYGKQEYLKIMMDGFYPGKCTLWMRCLIAYLNEDQFYHITPENSIKSLHKTIQKWAEKEKSRVLAG